MKLSPPFSTFLALALSFFLPSLPSVVLASASASSASSATASDASASTLDSNFDTSSRIYHLTEDIVGAGFYSHFEWENVTDPSHGRV
ncbi:hypothetical protein CVT26_014294 [Gymnopilus dilepis]|uniref:Uncharacterized protein n=1 Tax=Gymnopilus dilepis TaxID=231916 RepID=A0A409X1W3_9AGAR|nr:hypothetical protein CVT26_014294 [Gymnopilus dilepis]